MCELTYKLTDETSMECGLKPQMGLCELMKVSAAAHNKLILT